MTTGWLVTGVLILVAALAGCSSGSAGPEMGKASRNTAGMAVSAVSAQVVQPQPSAGSCHARGRGLMVLPDPKCTPGALNPQVTQETIAQTICKGSWAAGVRPPERVSEAEKRASVAAYGHYAGPRLSSYEYDHLVPISLGGAVNDARNLWPEASNRSQGHSVNPKDKLENYLSSLVCQREDPLVAAQDLMPDWIHAYRKLLR